MLRRNLKRIGSRLLQGPVVPLSLFAIGLLPRLLTLDAFLTADEARWLGRSRNFLIGILSQDWAATLQTGHPGVTTMWTGSLGILYKYLNRPPTAPNDLLVFVQQISSYPIDVGYVAPMRFPTALLTSLFLVAFYALVSRLFDDQQIGAIGALLLALNPFHIALSRVLHHHALASIFMTLTLLTWLGHWFKEWSRRWLLLSAVAAGLSVLSESPAMFLVPFCGLLGLVWAVWRWRRGKWQGWSDIGRLAAGFLIWNTIALLTVFVLWPAMWVSPFEVMKTVFGLLPWAVPLKIINSVISLGAVENIMGPASQYASQGYAKPNFLLGEITNEPGPLFYPLHWLLRTTPLSLLGLLVWAATYVRDVVRRREKAAPLPSLLAGMMLIFALLFTAFMSLAKVKQDRYILPTFPALELLAGLGLMRLWQTVSEKNLTKKWKPLKWLEVERTGQSNSAFLALTTVILVAQGVFALAHHPYYFTYYNPLLGAGRSAQQLVTVGWGQGLDLAAAYLNKKPDADHLRVTAWYEEAFAPYFRGQTTHFFSIGEAMNSDYLVFYQNQLQRQLPDPDLLAYYQQHHHPEHVVHMKGIDYALIYPVHLDHRTNWQLTNIFDKIILYGYRQSNPQPDTFTTRLVWENKGMSAEDGLWITLQRCKGNEQPPCREVVGWQPCELAPNFSQEEAQKIDVLVESECKLITEDLGPGIYSMRVGLGPSLDSRPSGYRPDAQEVIDILTPQGELGVHVPEIGPPVLISPAEALDALAAEVLPPEALPLHISYGDTVTLIGYQLSRLSPESNYLATSTLYWQAMQDIPQPAIAVQDFRVRFELRAPDGKLVTMTTDGLLSQAKFDDLWGAGQMLPDRHRIPLLGSLSPGEYNLTVALSKADTNELLPARNEATGQMMSDYVQLETAIVVP